MFPKHKVTVTPLFSILQWYLTILLSHVIQTADPGQIQPVPSFGIALKIRMDFTFLSVLTKKKKKEEYQTIAIYDLQSLTYYDLAFTEKVYCPS